MAQLSQDNGIRKENKKTSKGESSKQIKKFGPKVKDSLAISQNPLTLLSHCPTSLLLSLTCSPFLVVLIHLLSLSLSLSPSLSPSMLHLLLSTFISSLSLSLPLFFLFLSIFISSVSIKVPPFIVNIHPLSLYLSLYQFFLFPLSILISPLSLSCYHPFHAINVSLLSLAIIPFMLSTSPLSLLPSFVNVYLLSLTRKRSALLLINPPLSLITADNGLLSGVFLFPLSSL